MLSVSILSGSPEIRQAGWIGLYLIYLLSKVNLTFLVGIRFSVENCLLGRGETPHFGAIVHWVATVIEGAAERVQGSAIKGYCSTGAADAGARRINRRQGARICWLAMKAKNRKGRPMGGL
ncbi:hypothetical protein PXK00_11980 [Phaeobacter sp. QD34_3]|uniref:hypothetical protein n=1 Tax=unclassified Phaeobacter TaxID=2621772 RepID=UPI00237F1E4E|nr:MULTISPECIES: hypothetical protein [unclassified Phaeobacter]MDE4133833.1 hypothetical protein [Phaeobacter sp. QD34_3]MDE4174939.1 hypothetical protein [Phaeobacter sp. PT47_59]